MNALELVTRPVQRAIATVRTRSQTKTDALGKVRDSKSAIDRSLARPAPFDPAGNIKDRIIAVRLQESDEELQQSQPAVRSVRDQLAGHGSGFLLTLAMVILYPIECLGGIGLFKRLGYDPRERTIYGLGLATFLLTLTIAASRLATQKDKHGRPTRSPWLALTLVVFSVLVVAIAILRHDNMEASESGSTIADWAASIALLCATIGPAWLMDYFVRLRAPIARLNREKRNHQHRLGKAERIKRRCENHMTRRTDNEHHYDAELRRLTAYYAISYRRFHLKFHGVPPHDDTASSFTAPRPYRVVDNDGGDA